LHESGLPFTSSSQLARAPGVVSAEQVPKYPPVSTVIASPAAHFKHLQVLGSVFHVVAQGVSEQGVVTEQSKPDLPAVAQAVQ